MSLESARKLAVPLKSFDTVVEHAVDYFDYVYGLVSKVDVPRPMMLEAYELDPLREQPWIDLPTKPFVPSEGQGKLASNFRRSGGYEEPHKGILSVSERLTHALRSQGNLVSCSGAEVKP